MRRYTGLLWLCCWLKSCTLSRSCCIVFLEITACCCLAAMAPAVFCWSCFNSSSVSWASFVMAAFVWPILHASRELVCFWSWCRRYRCLYVIRASYSSADNAKVWPLCTRLDSYYTNLNTHSICSFNGLSRCSPLVVGVGTCVRGQKVCLVLQFPFVVNLQYWDWPLTGVNLRSFKLSTSDEGS